MTDVATKSSITFSAEATDMGTARMKDKSLIELKFIIDLFNKHEDFARKHFDDLQKVVRVHGFLLDGTVKLTAVNDDVCIIPVGVTRAADEAATDGGGRSAGDGGACAAAVNTPAAKSNKRKIMSGEIVADDTEERKMMRLTFDDGTTTDVKVKSTYKGNPKNLKIGYTCIVCGVTATSSQFWGLTRGVVKCHSCHISEKKKQEDDDEEDEDDDEQEDEAEDVVDDGEVDDEEDADDEDYEEEEDEDDN